MRPASRSVDSVRSIAILSVLLVGYFLNADAIPLPQFTIHPLATAPSVTVAPTPASVNTSTDPTLNKLAQWLQSQVGTIRSGNGPASPGIPRSAAREFQVRAAWERLKQTAGDGLQVRFRPEHGGAMFVSGTLAKPANHSGPSLSTTVIPRSKSEQTARGFLAEYHDLFLIDDPESEFGLVGDQTDEQGFRSLRFAQRLGGRTVWPAELIVRLDLSGVVYLVEGTQVPTPHRIVTDPKLTADEAAGRVFRSIPFAANGSASPAELVIFAPLDQAPRLAWKFDITVGLLTAWNFVVDASDGGILRRTSLVVDAAVKGAGVDVTGATRNLNLWQDGGTYYTVDTSKPMFDPTSALPNNGRGVIGIYDGGNKVVEDTQFSSGLVKSTSPTSGWLPDAVGSAWGLAATYDYFQDRFKRNSLDGQGGKISSIVRYDVNLANAFYIHQTKTMVFGDFETKFVEVTGHELTHGVTASSGNGGILEYQSQSGALNESLSDIFGNMVKLFATGAQDWKIRLLQNGKDTVIRDFQNPNNVINGGITLPKNMSQYVKLNADQDHGGVHVNSSINNHAFYLAAEGLPDAIGLKDAEQIFYRAQTMHLQKQSQFIDMRLAAVASAQELFGATSKQVSKIKEAYDGVEIFDAPDSPAPAPIPTISAPDSTLFLTVDPFFGNILLGRREQAAGDPNVGTILNTHGVTLSGKRISVTGDGAYAVFVTADNDIGVIQTDGNEVTFADIAGSIHSVAVSPDGSRIAVVLIDASSGLPQDQIGLVDLNTGKVSFIKLFSPAQDGDKALDIIKFADSMTFLPDGRRIIYDAYAEIPLQNGAVFSGWGIYSLDFATGQIIGLISLDDGLDFGNPSLGKVHPNLLTFEVVDKQTGISTIVVADLTSGSAKAIGQLTQQGVFGFPSFTGDDKAVIYSQVDLNTTTTISLHRQALAEDGVSPAGNPTLWLADADFSAIYRRGTFSSQNTPPTVTILSPTTAESFTVPVTIQVRVQASDAETSVAKVELYIGSTRIAESSQAPYNFSFHLDETPKSTLQLVARAIDTIGAEANSAPVMLNFGPRGSKGRLVPTYSAGILQLRVTGIANSDRIRVQGSTNLLNWITLTDLVAAGTEATYTDPQAGTFSNRYYRTLLNP